MNNTEGNKLSDKIREVFDNYEDEGAAEAWEQLRRKYPARDSRPVYLWISSVAAVLLLSTAIWFWPAEMKNNDAPNNKAQLANDSINSNNNIAKQVPAESAGEDTHLENRGFEKDIQTLEGRDDEPRVDDLKSKSVRTYSKLPETREQVEDNPIRSSSNRSTPPENDWVSRSGIIESATLQASTVNRIEQNDSASLAIKKAEMPELPGLDKLIAQAIQKDSISQRAINSMLAPATQLAALGKAVENTELPVQDSKESSYALSVYGGSFINFAAGSESALNFAAGLSSDLKISNRLKLSTGLSLARNSLSFENGIPANASRNDALSFNSPSSVPSGYLVSLNNYTAELINLDIPINLKYQLGHGKNDFFVSAGVSSGTFVSERYVSDYSTYNLNSGNYLGTTTLSSNKINKEFAEFDFARTLNFSFGFSTGFGKKQSLTFEPFLKYPLGGLGTQDIRFGSSGINVKLNLRNQK